MAEATWHEVRAEIQEMIDDNRLGQVSLCDERIVIEGEVA